MPTGRSDNGTTRELTMAGRIATSLFAAFCLLNPSPLKAAEGAPAGEYQYEYMREEAAPSWAPQPLTTTAVPKVRTHHYGGSVAPARPASFPMPSQARPGQPYRGPDGIVTTRVPPDDQWAEPSPLEATLYQVLKRSWYRLEYLQWSISRPGDTFLGAPLGTVIDPTGFFPVFDNQIPPNQIGIARVPNLSTVALRETDGIRGTIGIEFSESTLEASVFALEQASDTLVVPRLRPQEVMELVPPGIVIVIDPGEFAATSLLQDGEPSNIVELYNRNFKANFKSDILGAEVNLVLHDVIDFGQPQGIVLEPLFGFRYLMVQEELRQQGEFEDITGAVPLLTSVIHSDTYNHIFGPSVGIRTELRHEWFSIGGQASITAGTDVFRARVQTERFRLAADPTVKTSDRSVYFSPVGELRAYAQVHLTKDITLSVGYNLLQVMRLTRPHKNIYYNDKGDFPTPPAIVVKPNGTDLQIEGLTLGAEIRLP